MSKYILTGSNGNIGSQLELLLDNIPYARDMPINDEEVLLHLASKSIGEYKTIIKSNIDYLIEIINFCEINNIKKLIFFSAISIYNKQDIYSITKLLGEKILAESKLKILILRLPMVLTRDTENGILNRIVKKLEKNEEIFLSNADAKFNNFIGVKDISNFILTYKFEKKYELLNLASKNEHTLYEIVNFMREKISSHSKIIKIANDNNYYNINVDQIQNNYKFNSSSALNTIDEWMRLRKDMREI